VPLSCSADSLDLCAAAKGRSGACRSEHDPGRNGFVNGSGIALGVYVGLVGAAGEGAHVFDGVDADIDECRGLA